MRSMLTLGFAVFLWMCACAVKRQNTLYFFDRAATVPLRGLLVLFVIFAHLTLVGVDPAGMFSWFMWQNAAVSVFFFMSGYGQMRALKDRLEYPIGLIGRTARKLFVPLLILATCSAVGDFVTGGANWSAMLLNVKHGEFFLVPHDWYVIVLFVLTLAFSFLARAAKGIRLVIYVSLVAVVLASVLKWGLHWPRWWWLSVHAYPIGMLFCHEEPIIRKFVISRGYVYVVLGGLFGSMCILSALLCRSAVEGVMRGMIGPMVALGFYVLPISPKCRTLSFLGGISFELYICHGVIREWSLEFSSHELRMIVGLSSVVVAVITALFLHKIVEKINHCGFKHV